MQFVIHHNPKCGTSRKVLQAIRDAGHEPVVVEYLKTGWTRPQLQLLFAVAGMSPAEALRAKGTAAAELGLTAPDADPDAILDAMVADPVMVERPFVASPKGVRLCRPAERLEELL
ncbi:arsenate reductase (glutaredoxin) [Poseidonocella sp. HB161398]|uniref:arsenate reductase (glutaredoxin) n=1 Tax=Poseidonocella sp. HB161398 TaxID=2320855 RepID=UPI001108AEB0|nr:arsenate reductase (glutaredoxin) [Poseidonocella sp. HB161398]